MVQYSAQAEKSALGCCMISREACDHVCGHLGVDDFFFEQHRTIFTAILSIRADGNIVDFVTLSDKLEQSGSLEAAGDIPYLAEINQVVPSASHVNDYVGIVKDRSNRRKMEAMAQEVISSLGEGTGTNTILSTLTRAALEIEPKKSSEIVSMGEAVGSFFDYIDSPDVTGIPSGFHDLDDRTGGFRPGELILVAGRPGMGKTSMALALALNMAKSGHSVYLAECEMPAIDLTMRCASVMSGIPLVAIRNKRLNEDAMGKVMNASFQLGAYHLTIMDSSGWTVSRLRAAALKAQQIGKLDVLIIDYLQLLATERKAGNTNDMVADQTKRLKMLARELNIPIILLSQLNRAVEAREDKRPRLSDLRDSGAIEQDADAVLFLYRGHVYDEKIPDYKAEMIVAKLRNGPIGTVPVRWHPVTASYHDV